MNKVFEKVIGLLYPWRCPFCGEVSAKRVCGECEKKLLYVTEPRCKQCGKPVRYEEQEYCYDCRKTKHHFDEGRSLWIHKLPVNASIYQFKYANKRIYGQYYAAEMARVYSVCLQRWNIQAIIPIPLAKKRRKKRGYNQAEYIAVYLGKRMGIPVDTRVLKRVKETRPQKQLGDKERTKNIKDAFAVSDKQKIQKMVLLVDDIYTTGSTLDEAARVLKASGVQAVYFLTISIGQGF